MKLKTGYTLHEIAGETLLLPENSVDLNSMLTLNETAAFLWTHLQQETDEDTLTALLTAEYQVDTETARAHLKQFLQRLKELELLA